MDREKVEEKINALLSWAIQQSPYRCLCHIVWYASEPRLDVMWKWSKFFSPAHSTDSERWDHYINASLEWTILHGKKGDFSHLYGQKNNQLDYFCVWCNIKV